MTLLLDTNVLSDLRRRRAGTEQLFRWRETTFEAPKYISAMTVIELEFGVLRAEHKNMPHAPALRSWLGQVLEEFSDAVLSLDIEVARATARLQRIRTLPINDAIIAATALICDLDVVTRNENDFSGLGVRIINPWS